VQDTVCLTANTCADDVSFLGVVVTTGLEGLKSDGILGLAPSNQGSEADMFLDELFYAGLISSRVIAF
jgi:hypothetical protein